MSANPRGTSTQLGYGTKHHHLRSYFKPLVEAGQAVCWRCGKPIGKGEPWDLGHNDDDRTRYNGPEHRTCNRGAANKRPARNRRRNQAPALRIFNTGS
jgi:hypothetical protein